MSTLTQKSAELAELRLEADRLWERHQKSRRKAHRLEAEAASARLREIAIEVAQLVAQTKEGAKAYALWTVSQRAYGDAQVAYGDAKRAWRDHVREVEDAASDASHGGSPATVAHERRHEAARKASGLAERLILAAAHYREKQAAFLEANQAWDAVAGKDASPVYVRWEEED